MTERSDPNSTPSLAGAAGLSELAGRSVLVTGGGGFIGSRIADALGDVCDVTVLDDFSAGDPAAVPDDASVVHGDVRDDETVRTTMQHADVAFHQAGLTNVDQSVEAPLECHGRNASATATVLDAARRHDVRVVLASSAAVYGDPESLPVREADRKTPSSPYGVAKLAADQYTRVYADLYGLPTVALRYFNVYGDKRPGGNDVISQFLARARNGGPLEVHGDGSQTRDFVHVDDVVRANVLAAVTDETGRAYNVGTGEATSIRAVAKLIHRLAESNTDLTTGSRREGDVTDSCASIARARDCLGYEPTVELEDGLRSLLEAPAEKKDLGAAD